MKTPPFQLKEHIFTKILIEANKNIKFEDLDSLKEFKYNFSFGVKVNRLQDDDLSYQVELDIRNVNKVTQPAAYDINLVVFGVFVINESCPIDKREMLIQINGTSLLYGAAREMLFNLTHRGPYPPVYLPTVSFLPDDEKRTPSKKKTDSKKKKVIKSSKRSKKVAS